MPYRFQWKTLREGVRRHTDFLLLLFLYLFFRICSILFFRTGGYIRDYSDLIYYQSRASWQDFGLLPYRDYWSEYPPLFPWLTLLIDQWSQSIPLWDDERLWFAAIFGLITTAAEGATLISLYILANRLYPVQVSPNQAFRVVWLYAGFFLPVYLLGGWYDALAVMTIFVALTLLLCVRNWAGLLCFGIVVGIGGLLKLVPLALLAILPLALSSWPKRIIAASSAAALFVGGYFYAYLHGPQMTLTSLQSLTERSGWSTLYALSNRYLQLGTVQGDPFSTTPVVALYEAQWPQWPFLGTWLLIGLLALIQAWRQQRPPQSDHRVILFAALTYTILLLAYPAWNPQYALYLLPFLPLLWPNARGLLYATALTVFVLLEHPIYFNMIGPDYPPVYRALLGIEYQQLLIPLILSRTAILAAIALDLGVTLLRPVTKLSMTKLQALPVAAIFVIIVVNLALIPQYTRAYTMGRLVSSPVRALAIYFNADAGTPSLPIVTQQQSLGRELRPFLEVPDRLIFAGGRPARLDPLQQLLGTPLIYIQSADDGETILQHLETEHDCPQRLQLASWTLWYCNGAAPQPIAHFAGNLQLLRADISNRRSDSIHLTLFWVAEQQVEADYTAFIHVVDGNDQIVGQWDQVPGSGTLSTQPPRSTRQWDIQTIVVDDYHISLTPTRAAEPQRVWAGLYDAQTGERLPISESERPINENRLQLMTLPPR